MGISANLLQIGVPGAIAAVFEELYQLLVVLYELSCSILGSYFTLFIINRLPPASKGISFRIVAIE